MQNQQKRHALSTAKYCLVLSVELEGQLTSPQRAALSRSLFLSHSWLRGRVTAPIHFRKSQRRRGSVVKTRTDACDELPGIRAPIHRHRPKICLKICLKTITRPKLRCCKIILQHVLSEFAEFLLDDQLRLVTQLPYFVLRHRPILRHS